MDAAGNLYIVSGEASRVFRVARDGTRSRIVDVQGPVASAVDAAGNLYVTTTVPDNTLYKIPPGSTEPTRLLGPDDGVDGPRGIAIDKDGNVFVASETSGKVFRVAPDGAKKIVLDGSRPEDPDPIGGPFGVAVDSDGNLYVTGNKTNNVIKVTPGGAKREVPREQCQRRDGSPKSSEKVLGRSPWTPAAMSTSPSRTAARSCGSIRSLAATMCPTRSSRMQRKRR